MAIPKYKVKAGNSDVFAISIVENPAVESAFVALAKDEKPKFVTLSKEDKHMLYGIILRADFPIYRNDPDFGEYYLEFDADTIERLERKYMKNFSQGNWTKEHSMYGEGLTLVESWIVTDLESDKSKALGLEGVTVGSWIGGCLVDDNETWAQIKEGNFTGFSVEAWVDVEEVTKEIKNKKDIKMAKNKTNFDDMFEKIKDIITSAVNEAEGEDTTVQEEVVETAAEDVVEAVDAAETPQEEEMADESTPEEQIAEDVIEQVEENADTVEDAADDLQAVVDQLQQEVDDLKKENETLKKQNQKMSKQPSVKPNTPNGGSQKFSAIDQLIAMGFVK